MQKIFEPQHTGDDYLIHCLVAPKHYWDAVQQTVDRYRADDGMMEVHTQGWVQSESFSDYCAYHYEHPAAPCLGIRDIEHMGFASQEQADVSLPFVKFEFFLKDCEKIYGTDNHN